MLRVSMSIVLVAALFLLPENRSIAASPEQVRAAAEKSINLLQNCGPEFFRKSGCVACHHQSATSLALASARSRGLPVDEEIAREQVNVTAFFIKTNRDVSLQRVDEPFNSGQAAGFLLWGLAAEDYAPDSLTDVNVMSMAGFQKADGSWSAFAHRPPLEYSRISATALAIRALQLYGPPGRKKSFDARIKRGRDWLLTAEPTSNTDESFRLLGLSWAGADRNRLAKQRAVVLSQQNDDGGWSQLKELPSDAYATGLTLYALHHSGALPTTDPAYRRGVDYLMNTQLQDGSWHVKTRSFPFQKYFESGFPHGHDQWISATATGFATAAIIDSLPPIKPEAR